MTYCNFKITLKIYIVWHSGFSSKRRRERPKVQDVACRSPSLRPLIVYIVIATRLIQSCQSQDLSSFICDIFQIPQQTRGDLEKKL